MKAKQSLALYIIHITILSLVLFTGCSTQEQNNMTFLSNNEEQSIEVKVFYDYPVAENLEAMATEADVVVRGTFSRFKETWNMARHPVDISEPDRENYVEGHLYEFDVDEVILGQIDNKQMTVNYRYSELIQVENSKEDLFDITVEDPRYIKPELNTEYILFLNYDDDFDNYYGAIEPFQLQMTKDSQVELITKLTSNELQIAESANNTFTLDDGTIVHVDSELDRIDDHITGLKFEDIITKIKNTMK
ncbi:hypothetical protein SAMN05421736_101207 [Evansella caseinilytica]|uniref:Uncharacterized protein n=1 Tax=Evansella caseinilytica TaxID=1503961 RepID=A0A1H3GM03_9BACI|nr:hypothetical protein [Evansella caseinilytica]SDY04025.1 hypothetical protein SAMN05421736_101207 [Evansella caseinilytica]